VEDIIRRSEEESEGAAKLLQLWGYLESRDDWYELFLWSLYWEQAPSWLPQVADTEVVFLVTLKLLLEFSLVEAECGRGKLFDASSSPWLDSRGRESE
jgi:hypothetical protein